MATQDPKDLLDALSAPVGELIASVGRGVAEAQQEMDAQTLATIRSIYGESGNTELLSTLRQIGYQPTWYHIPEVTAEINVAISIVGQATQQAQTTGATTSTAGKQKLAARPRLYAAPVDAGYSNRYGYDVKAASVVKFRIVPVPPSANTENLRVVPNLLGKTFAQARTALDTLGITYRVGADTAPADTAPVKAQTPAAGELIPGSRELELSF